MALKKYRPVTPGRRLGTVSDFAEITRPTREKSLVEGIRGKGGRNNQGRTTVRFRGGGHRRAYRIVDFKRDKDGIPAKVISIEYDPNRSARIALLTYEDGEKRYILAPDALSVGDSVMSGSGAPQRIGNCLPIREIVDGTMLHGIELKIGKGAAVARSAGAQVQLMAKEGDYAQLKLPSGEVRKVHLSCRATIGQLSNPLHENVSYGKAGRVRWLGRRPHNRGLSMNPVDHPMGGGEGKSSGGRHPCSPWGWITRGRRTRRNKRTQRMIVRRRS
jgi:large subunit ribosomal protein L2